MAKINFKKSQMEEVSNGEKFFLYFSTIGLILIILCSALFFIGWIISLMGNWLLSLLKFDYHLEIIPIVLILSLISTAILFISYLAEGNKHPNKSMSKATKYKEDSDWVNSYIDYDNY